MNVHRYILALSLWTVAAHGNDPACCAEPELNFNRDIRPILSENCFHCHGADAAQRQADLRLDVRDAAIEQGALTPGDVNASAMIDRIASNDPDLKMPPPDSQRRLTSAQVAALTRWIAEGAEYETHWAFQPVVRPTPPQVQLTNWSQNDIDRFVLAQLEQQGLAPSPRASLPTLLRRISFDLTGLPPTPEQITAWHAADDPLATALDELLASPHYGERLAADWLDVARYADTHGFNNDSARTMWRWRDWVVDAFNANMPYDRFIIKQLAGDLLPDASLEDRIATAFNRNHVINSEGGIIDEEYRVEYVADRIRTISLAWLGLTMECARCHDHKFDPVTQRDYYQLFAFFNSIDEVGEDGRVDNAGPLMRAPTREQLQRYQGLVAREDALHAKVKQYLVDNPLPLKREAEVGLLALLEQPEQQTPQRVVAAPALEAALTPTELPAERPLTANSLRVDLNAGWTFSAWVKRTNDKAAPLLSTQNFAVPASSQGYGDGLHIGFTSEGALEVRLAVRWPGYALSVRSVETTPVDCWRHVVVTGSGAKASGIRIFIDGVEVETDVRHDDLTGGVQVEGTVLIGHSGEAGANSFSGSLSRLLLFASAFEPQQLDALVTREALIHSPAGDDDPTSWPLELLHATHELSPRSAALAELAADWKAARTERLLFQRTFPTLMIMRELREPRETYVLQRGQYDRPADRVRPDVPAALGGPLPPGTERNRVTFARWLTDPRHPLTSRVVVNRYWHNIFGVGLVKTVEDFGSQGEFPSHPELLDWLAAEFVEHGWDVKHLLRLILTSATYQQDSSARPEQWANDPENRLLARGPRQRLTAEMIRDQALAASGLLTRKLGGPPVFPYQPADFYKGIVVAADYPGTSYTESQGQDLYRRSLYTFWKRTVPHPTFTTFDAPDREFCAARRSVTNTPLQALVLMNDPTFLEAARHVASRMLSEGGATDDARIAWGFKLLSAREPEPFELATLLHLLQEQRVEFAANAAPPRGLLAAGASSADEVHDPVEVAAYASVAGVLLNLDEIISKN